MDGHNADQPEVHATDQISIEHKNLAGKKKNALKKQPNFVACKKGREITKPTEEKQNGPLYSV